MTPVAPPLTLIFTARWRSAAWLLTAPLEELHRALMLLRGRARLEGAEVAAPAGLGILLSRIQPVLACLQLSNHVRLRRCLHGSRQGACRPRERRRAQPVRRALSFITG